MTTYIILFMVKNSWAGNSELTEQGRLSSRATNQLVGHMYRHLHQSPYPSVVYGQPGLSVLHRLHLRQPLGMYLQS